MTSATKLIDLQIMWNRLIAVVAEGRKRYVAYKKQSYPLTHFVAGKT